MRYQAVMHAGGKAAVIDTFLMPPCNAVCECDNEDKARVIAEALELRRLMGISETLIEAQRKLIKEDIDEAIAKVVKGLRATAVDAVRDAARRGAL